MDVFPADRGLSPVKELRDSAFTGSLPEWVVDDSDGGTVAARDASNDGGFWELSPGDGRATLRTAFSIDPGAYDVLELESRLRATGDVAALVGFENTAESLVYGFDANGRSIDDRVRAATDSGEVTFDARAVDGGYQHAILLRWDVARARAELSLDGAVAATGDVDDLDAEKSVSAFWRADGQAGEFRVYDAALRYRSRHNTV